MKLVIFILNNPDLQETFLGKLYNAGIRGGTILDSMGMAKKQTDYQNEDLVSVLKPAVYYSSGCQQDNAFLYGRRKGCKV